MSSSVSTRLSSRPRDGDIREQRPDAALDVLGAGLREHGKQQSQAPPDMLTGQSIRACLRRAVTTDHEAHSQDAAGIVVGTSVVRTLKQSFGGSALRRPKRKHDEPEETSARSQEAEQSKV